jgi:hypothetical protein
MKMYLYVYIYDRPDFNQWGFKIMGRDLVYHKMSLKELDKKDITILKMDGIEIIVEAKDTSFAATHRGEYGNIPNTVAVVPGDLVRIEVDLS